LISFVLRFGAVIQVSFDRKDDLETEVWLLRRCDEAHVWLIQRVKRDANISRRLSYTQLFIRMRLAPGVYSFFPDAHRTSLQANTGRGGSLFGCKPPKRTTTAHIFPSLCMHRLIHMYINASRSGGDIRVLYPGLFWPPYSVF
jgi:hypothetical protein